MPAHALAVTPDPDDNKFLECVDAARADYLVTGNPRHFPKFWNRTKVITSRELSGLVAPHLIPLRKERTPAPDHRGLRGAPGRHARRLREPTARLR